MNPSTATADATQEAAFALREARASRRTIAPISISHGITGLEAAYAVAEVNTLARNDAGARVVGKKVGLTSKAVQTQLGVDQPDFGMLFDDMEILNGETATSSDDVLERVKGIEPSYEAWEAAVLPLNYTRELRQL
jgi:2-keto-4-pentenoate hydratase